MVDWTNLRLRYDCSVGLRCEVERTNVSILLRVPVGKPHPTGTWWPLWPSRFGLRRRTTTTEGVVGFRRPASSAPGPTHPPPLN